MLRPATADDAALIAQLHIDSWRSAYRDILDAAYLAGPMGQRRYADPSSPLAGLI